MAWKTWVTDPLPQLRPTLGLSLGFGMYVNRRLTAAFPPIFRILCPASDANGWVDATMPPVLCTTLRLLANWAYGASAIG